MAFCPVVYINIFREYDSGQDHHRLWSKMHLSLNLGSATYYPQAVSSDRILPIEAILLMCLFLPAILFLKYINLIVSKPNRFNDPSLFKGRT